MEWKRNFDGMPAGKLIPGPVSNNKCWKLALKDNWFYIKLTKYVI